MLYKWKCPENVNTNPQCVRMTDEYYHKTNIIGLKGSAFPGGRLDYIPYADAFKMHPNTRKTDFVTTYEKSSLDWLVSPPFADFLQTFNLPEYQVFDAVVEYRAKRYPYKIIHFCYENLEIIDYTQSSWYITKRGYKHTYEKINILCAEDYQKQAKLLPFEKKITAKKLVINEDIKADVVRLHFVDVCINDRLKTAIQGAGFTGIDFAPVPNPLYQHLVWADTGLPVQD